MLIRGYRKAVQVISFNSLSAEVCVLFYSEDTGIGYTLYIIEEGTLVLCQMGGQRDIDLCL